MSETYESMEWAAGITDDSDTNHCLLFLCQEIDKLKAQLDTVQKERFGE